MTDVHSLRRAVAAAHGIDNVDFSDPADGVVRANDLDFHYVDWGGRGFPILFLHGGGQSCRTWDMVCLQLRDRYRCFALDQRNHGDSARAGPGGMDFWNQREDVAAVIGALGLERCAVVGMSMGGLNTMAFAATRPAGLDAVAIVDITPTAQPEGARPIGRFSAPQTFESIEDALEKAVAFNPSRAREHLHYSLLYALRQREDGKWVWKHEALSSRADDSAPADAAASVDGGRGYLERFLPLWDEVGKIACPALVVHGGDSKVIRREDAERLAAAIPRGEVVTIPGAGHTVQGDQPVRFAAALTEFLGRVMD